MSQEIPALLRARVSHCRIRAWTLAGALLLTLAAQAADPARLDVKLGLWEVTSNSKSSGVPPIPDDVLQKLPPAQREQFQAQMRSSMRGGAKSDTHRSCMTPEKLAQGFNTREDRRNCQRQLQTNTDSEIVMTEVCTRHDGTENARIHLQRVSRELVKGTINITVGSGPNTMSIDADLSARWLGADCGDVK